jgi:hypothetical protein
MAKHTKRNEEKRTIDITIDSCTDCPKCIKEDGGQGTLNLTCRVMRDKIAIHHEDPRFCAIPEWCPFYRKPVRYK